MNLLWIAPVIASFAWAETNAWDDVLARLYLTPSDFTIRHEEITDPFRLPLVSSLLNEPLQALPRSHQEALAIRKSRSPSQLIKIQMRHLDLEGEFTLPVVTPAEAGVQAWIPASAGMTEKIQVNKEALTAVKAEISKLPANEEFKRALISAAEAAILAKTQVAEALKDFPESKQRQLLEWALPELTGGLPEQPETLDIPDQTSWEKEEKIWQELLGFPRDKILAAAKTLTQAIEAALPLLAQNASSLPPAFQTKTIETPRGNIIVGGRGTDRHDKDALLIVDSGGNDSYEMENSLLLLDLSGNDLYLNEKPGQGAGVFGISVLADAQGNDRYLARDLAQGAGVFGAGILWDLAGDDFYQARAFAQGSGFQGSGLLLDDSGTDFYQLGYLGQGAGLPGGHGLLKDTSGNDRYDAGGAVPDPRGWIEKYAGLSQGEVSQAMAQGFGLGFREQAAGGIGILADTAGNDSYELDYFGQGGSYWLGWGMLYDASGNDRYSARRYAQGSGVHFAAGTLLDESGNDRYASWSVSQGTGHDYSLGLLWDGEGGDSYTAEPTGFLNQGASNACAVGLLIDGKGGDIYALNNGIGLGFSGWDEKREAQGIGIVLDSGEGPDSIAVEHSSEPWTREIADYAAAFWETQKRPLAAQVQAEEFPAPDFYLKRRDAEKHYYEARLNAAYTLGDRSRLSEFLSVASAGSLDGSAGAQAKWELWKNASEKNLARMISFLDPRNSFASLNLVEIFSLYGKPGIAKLAASYPGLDSRKKRRALYVLAELRSADSLPVILAALKDPEAGIRRQAARALSKILDKEYLERLKKIEKHLENSQPNEIQKLLAQDKKADLLELVFRAGLPENEWPHYFAGLSSENTEPDQTAKAAAWLGSQKDKAKAALRERIQSLESAGTRAQDLTQSLKDTDRDVRKWSVVGLRRARYEGLLQNAETLLADPDYTVRQAAVIALSQMDKSNRPAIEKLAKTTPNPTVHALAQRALNKSK